MAEVIESHESMEHKFASNSKGNAGLTLGIIGTSLGAMAALGAGIFGATKKNSSTATTQSGMTDADLYIERQQCQNYLDITKQYYEGKLENQQELARLFFDAYDRDVKNSFDLYKYSRDNKDELNDKIAALSSKVDVMAAIRPYQDALINEKIDRNAILSDFNLMRRTCRMIQGELVLPSTPTVTGYPSQSLFNYYQDSSI